MTIDALAIGPHPDDVELGCGGTLALLTDRGYRVAILDLTEATLSTRGDIPNRHKEANAAASVLGITGRYQLGLNETAIPSSPDALPKLVEIIRRHRPYLVLAPYWDDRHPDHSDASDLVRRAAFWAGVSKFGDRQPPHRPHRVVYYYLHRVADVSMVVDISVSFDRKLKAIRAFRSQFLPQPGSDAMTFISRPEFLENFISRARYFGSLIGAEYGEPFHIREMNRVEDLVAWAGLQGLVG
jgi:bacillithiol biosynthesis deacetylase BshB1